MVGPHGIFALGLAAHNGDVATADALLDANVRAVSSLPLVVIAVCRRIQTRRPLTKPTASLKLSKVVC